MKTKRKTAVLYWAILLLCLLPLLFGTRMRAQRPALDLSLHYTAQYTQIVDSCVNCHWLQGGGLELQMLFTPHLAAALDATVTQASNIKPRYSAAPQAAYDLQQATYMAGLYYFPTRRAARIRPFADLLMGAAYATGSLSPSNIHDVPAAAFAFQTGAGLRIRLTHRLDITPVRGDYLFTTYDDPNLNTQRALRWSTGITFQLR